MSYQKCKYESCEGSCELRKKNGRQLGCIGYLSCNKYEV